jgi:hypothetical protein
MRYDRAPVLESTDAREKSEGPIPVACQSVGGGLNSRIWCELESTRAGTSGRTGCHLEDSRALYSQAVWEEPSHVVQSLFKIRDELTTGLKRVGDNSPAKEAFRIMRAACRDFLTLTSAKAQEQNRGMMRETGYQQEEFFVGLGTLRATFGQQLAVLGYLYGVDIEESLATILPPEAEK